MDILNRFALFMKKSLIVTVQQNVIDFTFSYEQHLTTSFDLCHGNMTYEFLDLHSSTTSPTAE